MALYVTLFIVYLLVAGGGYWLRYLNLSHLRLHGAELPPGFEKVVDAEMLAKTAAYTLEKGHVEQMEAVLDDLLVAVFIFGGALAVYDRWISSIFGSFVGGGRPTTFPASFPALPRHWPLRSSNSIGKTSPISTPTRFTPASTIPTRRQWKE